MTRNFFLLALLSFSLPAFAAEELKPVKHLIDTHIHLYDTTRDIEMSWPPKTMHASSPKFKTSTSTGTRYTFMGSATYRWPPLPDGGSDRGPELLMRLD